MVGLELRITELEGKFKLGQNRSAEDQQAALAALERHRNSDLANLTRPFLPAAAADQQP